MPYKPPGGQRPDGRAGRRLQGARAAAVRQRQPAARRPALHITDDEAQEGLALLDDALGVADEHAIG